MGWADYVCEKLAVPPGLKGSTSLVWSLTDAQLGGISFWCWSKSCLMCSSMTQGVGHRRCTLSKFSADLHARLGRSVDVLEATAAIQSSLGKLQEWASANLVMVNRDKCKVLNAGQTVVIQRYRLRANWLGSSPAEKGLAILVDKSSSWEFNTYRAVLPIYPAGMWFLCSTGEVTLDIHCPVLGPLATASSAEAAKVVGAGTCDVWGEAEEVGLATAASN